MATEHGEAYSADMIGTLLVSAPRASRECKDEGKRGEGELIGVSACPRTRR
ncbi:hypothetical protein ACQPZQ_06240 [Pseudonocardia sp. CA-142604]|uniref:hypothetical protein n=1 Tax=Pseudonocardia sp. CA-142604 TaxID=3240024 RepID=UPI003D94735B